MSLSKFTLTLISSQVWPGGASSVLCVCVLTLWLKYYWLLQKEDAVNIHAQVFFWTHTCIFSWADTWEWSGRIIQSMWTQHFRTCQLPPVSTFSLWVFQLLCGTLGTWEGRSPASGCFSSCVAPSARGKAGLPASGYFSSCAAPSALGKVGLQPLGVSAPARHPHTWEGRSSASRCFSSCAAPSARGKVGLQPSQHMRGGISLWLFTCISWMAMRLSKVSCA